MLKPSISVGLYVYNGERFLERSVGSILGQTFEDFELIISDNCSTDRTEEICRALASGDARIRYFRAPKNMGAGWNSRRVLELAEGKYFKWAAHDDMCEPEFLEACHRALESDPGVVLAHSQTRVVDENGTRIEDYSCPMRTDNANPLVRFDDLISIGHRCYQMFGVMRVDVLRQMPPLGSHAHSDRLMLARFGLSGRFHEDPRYLFINTVHPGQSIWNLPARVKGRGFRLTDHSGTLPALEWWDPSKSRRIAFPEWKLFRGYAASLLRSGLRPDQKIAGSRHLFSWALKSRRRLAKDLLIAGDQILYNLQNPVAS